MNCNDEPVDQCNPELSIPCVIEGSKHLAINIKFPVTSLRNSTNFHCEFAPVHPLGRQAGWVRHTNGLILIKAFYEKSKT